MKIIITIEYSKFLVNADMVFVFLLKEINFDDLFIKFLIFDMAFKEF